MTDTNQCIFGPLLSQLHDGELPDDRRREVLEHVRACAACSAELADMRRFGGVLAAASPPAISESHLDDLFARSQAEAASAEQPVPLMYVADADRFRPAAGEARHLRYVRWVSGLAAAVFLVAIGRVAYQQLGSDPQQMHPIPPANTTGLEQPVSPETQPSAENDPTPLPRQ